VLLVGKPSRKLPSAIKWLKTYLKSARYACQRIFVAFGKVNNTQGGDHPYLETSENRAAVGKVLPIAPFAIAIIAHWAWVFNSPLVPNQLHSTFTPFQGKKNAPLQRSEGARGFRAGCLVGQRQSHPG